jgi:hypothetical protein
MTPVARCTTGQKRCRAGLHGEVTDDKLPPAPRRFIDLERVTENFFSASAIAVDVIPAETLAVVKWRFSALSGVLRPP